MGWGDELIATAHALTVPGPVAILDRFDKPRWHAAWIGNNNIASPDDYANGNYASAIYNAPRVRPYIEKFEDGKWAFRPGVIRNLPLPELYLNDEEMILGKEMYGYGRFMTIEPNVNPSNSINKDWGFDKWQDLVIRTPHIRWVQPIQENSRRLDGVFAYVSGTMREICGVLSHANGHVGIEGGLHHSAAALRKPAVVIFGGFIGPDVTGYDMHINLSADTYCGLVSACEHCRQAMADITVDMVEHHANWLWEHGAA